MTTRVPAAQSLLAIDIGNSRIGMGVWDADGVHDVRRIPADQPDDLRPALAQTWAAAKGDGRRAVVIASVVPPRTRAISDLAAEVCGVEPLRVRDDVPLPMPLDVDNAAEVGVDRVCVAAAAFERVGKACAVASFGTATTIDCVSPAGRFMGGVILPGLEMSYDVLARRTSALPRVEQAVPAGPFGRNTQEAIINGVTYGAVGALREIVERFATELGEWPHLMLTGGAAPLIAGLADFVDSVVPDLSLMGIALAYRRAAGV